MPSISMFYGIIIRMYNTGEHNPPGFPYGNAVFHAYYGESEGIFDLAGEMTEGGIPK